MDKMPSLLKLLREKKNLSQSELARLIKASRKKLHSIEHKLLHKLELGELNLFAKALGFKLRDIMHLIEAYFQVDLGIKKIALETSLSELSFEEGVKMRIYVDEERGMFLGMLMLEPGKSVKIGLLPFRDFIFGFILEGTLLIDALGLSEQVIKSKQAFYFDQSLPIEFCNTDSCHKLLVLFFSISVHHV